MCACAAGGRGGRVVFGPLGFSCITWHCGGGVDLVFGHGIGRIGRRVCTLCSLEV